MTKPLDPVALRIGATLRRGDTAALADHAEAGRLLAQRKASLKHGEWLPWLNANAPALGFSDRATASRLMKLAKEYDAPRRTISTEAETTKKLWGHNKRTPTPAALADSLLEPQQSYEWYTPLKYVALVKKVLGQIDLDVASCAEANKYVKARRYFTKEQDALQQSWKCRALYGNVPFPSPIMSPFVDKLIVELSDIDEAIWLTHTPTDLGWFHQLLEKAAAVCFTAGRIQFIAPGGQKGGSPPSGCAWWYLGDNVERFKEVFAEIGTVIDLHTRHLIVEPPRSVSRSRSCSVSALAK